MRNDLLLLLLMLLPQGEWKKKRRRRKKKKSQESKNNSSNGKRGQGRRRRRRRRRSKERRPWKLQFGIREELIHSMYTHTVWGWLRLINTIIPYMCLCVSKYVRTYAKFKQ